MPKTSTKWGFILPKGGILDYVENGFREWSYSLWKNGYPTTYIDIFQTDTREYQIRYIQNNTSQIKFTTTLRRAMILGTNLIRENNSLFS